MDDTKTTSEPLDTQNTSEQTISENDLQADVEALFEEPNQEQKEEQKELSAKGQVASASAEIARGNKSLSDFPEWIQDEIKKTFSSTSDDSELKKLNEKMKSMEDIINAQKNATIKKEQQAFKDSVIQAVKGIKPSDREAYAKFCIEKKKAGYPEEDIFSLADTKFEKDALRDVKEPEKAAKSSGATRIEDISSPEELDAYWKAQLK